MGCEAAIASEHYLYITTVRQGHLPWDALDVAEEMPFDGKEARTLVLLAPFPALVLGLLPLRPSIVVTQVHPLQGARSRLEAGLPMGWVAERRMRAGRNR